MNMDFLTDCKTCFFYSGTDCTIPDPSIGCFVEKDREIEKLRGLLSDAYKEISGKENHASDCAACQIPAENPARCDCEEV